MCLIAAQESQSMKEDLNVWLLFLKDYNGTTVMLDQFWSSNSDLELFTDSAGGIGFGIYFNHKRAQACWPKDWEEIDILSDATFL